MKKLITILSFSMFIPFVNSQITITQSEDMETIESLVACAAQDGSFVGFNSFSRSFVLSDYGITSDFEITEVQFAVALLDADLPFTLAFFTSDAPYPTGTLTYLGSESPVLTPSDAATVVTYQFEEPIIVPAGSELVFAIEADGEADLINWRVGGNLNGETAPSYLTAPTCGANDPITLESIGFEGHLIMSITGNGSLGTTEIGENALSIYPNPAVDVINFDLKNGAKVESVELVNLAGQILYSSKSISNKINVSYLPSGIYLLRVKDINGKMQVNKFVKK